MSTHAHSIEILDTFVGIAPTLPCMSEHNNILFEQVFSRPQFSNRVIKLFIHIELEILGGHLEL